jgi:tRNA modification GTPase
MNSVTAQQDTIVALATPPGSGALGLVRLSGPQAVVLADSLFGPAQVAELPSHTARWGQWRRPDGSTLDEVVLTVFRAPRSYTREDTVEISAHGSPYILQTLVQDLVSLGARPAEPGEFTRRAWLNGAFDLAQAEAVADLIAAENAAAHRIALNQLRGSVSNHLAQLRQELIDLAALLELELDFSEEDVAFADRSQLNNLLDRTDAEVCRLRDSFQAGNALKTGIPVVLAGRPNAGKSTLLNALLGDERAIVSSIPGTTRDVIEDILHLNGYTFRLYDTAGLRDTVDPVEAEGVQRTQARLRQTALVLYLFDCSQQAAQDAAEELAALPMAEGARCILLATHADVASAALPPNSTVSGFPVLALAVPRGTGLAELREWLTLQARSYDSGEVLLTNVRHRDALDRCHLALGEARAALQSGLGQELIALDLHRALYALGEITGQVSPDDILGSIFSRFCIGK